jgi:hypothetical protein
MGNGFVVEAALTLWGVCAIDFVQVDRFCSPSPTALILIGRFFLFSPTFSQ